MVVNPKQAVLEFAQWVVSQTEWFDPQGASYQADPKTAFADIPNVPIAYTIFLMPSSSMRNRSTCLRSNSMMMVSLQILLMGSCEGMSPVALLETLQSCILAYLYLQLSPPSHQIWSNFSHMNGCAAHSWR